jgi:hypothetical protein
MRRLLFGTIALICAVGAAAAQQAAYVWTPLAFSALSVTSAAAIGLGTGGAIGSLPTSAFNARLVQLCIDSNQVRYRDDGTAPTTTTGMPWVQSQTPCFPYSGNLTAIQFIAVATTTTLSVSFYR